MQQKKDTLSEMRQQVQGLIEKHYVTTEKFCWEKDLSKATLSNFLSEGRKKDFQLSTLENIARALGKKLVIRLE